MSPGTPSRRGRGVWEGIGKGSEACGLRRRPPHAPFLQSPGLPIWASLSASRCELYREIVSVHAGAAPAALGTALGAPPGSRLWGRHYLFWRGGVPLTAIYEVFSPSLEQYVGTACAAAASGRQG